MNTLPQTPTPRPDTMAGNTPSQGSQFVETQGPEIDLFRKLNSYPFTTDVEFAKGLSIILGHPNSPATEAEIGCEDDLQRAAITTARFQEIQDLAGLDSDGRAVT
ncbi:conserved hypothetical protein [Aspergillus fumigatus A1163]|uniref:PEX14-like helix-turn-helix domain-containing protein n=1 Tax=Aspergillus fumigatus (strain CBS 144.89 / FGSC A1163 / CEA10) TaxID=451804 RepID=B0Y342_ASPFC|nr:conserved hypothetical protein [Aspergillus fumigatus A1163]